MIARIAFAAALTAYASSALACDPKSYTAYPREQVTELFGTLKDGRDELARIQAYTDLSCSSDQTIRTLAMQTALKKGNPPLLRGKALQDVIGSMASYTVELGRAANVDEQTKRFLDRTNGSITYRNQYYDPAKACVSLGGSSTSCYPPMQLQMRADRVDLQHGNDHVVGEFRLDDDTTLVGRLKFDRGVFLPARIKLF